LLAAAAWSMGMHARARFKGDPLDQAGGQRQARGVACVPCLGQTQMGLFCPTSPTRGARAQRDRHLCPPCRGEGLTAFASLTLAPCASTCARSSRSCSSDTPDASCCCRFSLSLPSSVVTCVGVRMHACVCVSRGGAEPQHACLHASGSTSVPLGHAPSNPASLTIAASPAAPALKSALPGTSRPPPRSRSP
jgi:hypothetical protein